MRLADLGVLRPSWLGCAAAMLMLTFPPVLPACEVDVPGAAAVADAPPAAPGNSAGALLSNVRQLIFEGRRSGEGYFSTDGRELVFQSEREAGNPFYQIYVMDLETGDTTRISPGTGKTTCGWISPSGLRVLFASTHDDPAASAKQEAELKDRAEGRQRRYAWDYDEKYELYALDRNTKQYQRLTEAPGYDAEGSYSPDGKWIAFASNRAAYSESLSDAQREKLQHDPSYFIDLYIMPAEGGQPKRLTNTPGYDGGPFFSPDGRRICWRRFSEDGATAEIFTMNVDGSDVRQLTHMGAMSWAPFYHPSGKYLIFTTNKHGFGNFELYLVNVDGGTPLRVTEADKFDGLPAFSPDGKRVAWTCSRTSDGQAQLFLADWDHEEALRRLKALNTNNRVSAAVEINLPPARTTEPAIRAEDIRTHVEVLASKEFEGRLTGTAGERAATAYVAREFARIGLLPDGDDGTYFDSFEFVAGVSLDEGNELTVRTPGAAGAEVRVHEVDQDWRPLAFSSTGSFKEASVVFAGYGILAPKSDEFPGLDSYRDLDVSDKWVLVLRFEPPELSAEHRQYVSRFSGLRYKAMIARDKGACGMIVVSGPDAKVKDALVRLEFDAAVARTSLAAISSTDALVEPWFRANGTTLEEQVQALRSGSAIGELKDVRVAATIALRHETRRGRNVVGRLAAKQGAVQAPFVALGAHVDHLGRGQAANSLAASQEADQVHVGADDNASGVAAMIEAAEWLSDLKERGSLDLKRDVVFVAWSGEELGLIGSKHYVDEIATGLGSGNDIRQRVVAYLNMDMVGRLSKSLLLAGVGSSSVWRSEVEQRNAALGLPVVLQEDGYLPTDATSFYLKGVPILSAFTGVHAEYHTPRDTPETLNYDGAAKVARFMALVARGLAAREDVPDFIAPSKPDPSAGRGGRANLRAYLGTIPDYTPAEVPGLKLSGVATGGPAHAAGLRGGDVIVELAGRKVENIYDYTYALETLRVGEAVRVAVMRDGQRMEFSMTPGSRE